MAEEWQKYLIGLPRLNNNNTNINLTDSSPSPVAITTRNWDCRTAAEDSVPPVPMRVIRRAKCGEWVDWGLICTFVGFCFDTGIIIYLIPDCARTRAMLPICGQTARSCIKRGKDGCAIRRPRRDSSGKRVA